MTGHSSINKKVYCAIWPESLAGRSGNDIASAIIAILKRVAADHPQFSEITTWSDSCVPQNRNSVLSIAIAKFLKESPHIEKITLKYSLPGHSAVQEIDSAHSQIEKASQREYFSPLSFIRILLNCNRNNPFVIIQLRTTDFHNYQLPAKSLNYGVVPYTKVAMLTIAKDRLDVVQYKLSHLQCDNLIKVSIVPPPKSTRHGVHGVICIVLSLILLSIA